MTSAPERSTRARTLSAAPPIATSSWSKPQARAVPTVWSSSVARPNGNSCFGRPSRDEPPAARTRPETNGSALGIADGPGGEALAASLAAEVERRDVPTAHRHDLGEDRKRDLLGRVRGDVQPGRRANAGAQVVVDVQRREHRGAAPAAGHEADVRNAVAQRALERALLVPAVRGDDDGE